MTVVKNPASPPASTLIPDLNGLRHGARKRSGTAKVELARRALPPYPYLLKAEEACSFFGTRPSNGLEEGQVREHRARFGPNALAEKEGKSLWALIGEQFEDLLVRILLAAAVISFGLALLDGDQSGLSAFVEPLVILLILIANAIVSIWQESNAEKSLEALKKLQPDVARVLRSGHWSTIPSEDLVPGDVVEVRVGDKVPADLRLIEIYTTTLKMEESQLTGEASAVCKMTDPMGTDNIGCETQAKRNLLFCTTTVVHGRGLGLVIATGMATEIGVIQAAVVDAGEDEESSPLQQKLDQFSEQLSKVIGVICLLVWLINFNHFSVHGSFLSGCVYYFKIAVALAVAAIPEGLPAVITTCLALGTSRMAKRHAIVRRLLSVETLGCTTVICSDKTGTLTTNEMSVVQFAMVDSTCSELDHYSVEGHSFDPVGQVRRLSRGQPGPAFSHIGPSHVALAELAKVCALCSEAKLEFQDGRIKRTGEPTEAALKVLVEKLGCPDLSLNARALQQRNRHTPEIFCNYWASDFDLKAILEFSRNRKSMSVLVRRRDERHNRMLVKGAPESILERCATALLPDGQIVPLTEGFKSLISREVSKMASKALRTLALATKESAGLLATYDGPRHPMHPELEDHENFIR